MQHSAVIHELRGEDGRYTQSVPQTAPPEQEMYVAAEPLADDSYYAYSPYVNPEDYDYNTNHHTARIPSVVVEQPTRSASTGATSPSSSSTPASPTAAVFATSAAAVASGGGGGGGGGGDSSNQKNGVYTSLKRGLLDADTVYTTPVSNRSTTSLQNLISDREDETKDDEEYVCVDGTSAQTNYLALMATDNENMKRSLSNGMLPRSPSPSYRPPPPPTAKKPNIYQNTQAVVVPSGIRNTGFRRASADGRMSSPEDQQIYENSVEAVPSPSPYTNGAVFKDGIHSANLAQSPRSLVPPEKQIYENSQEGVHLEDEEDTADDIYENDLPCMNQLAPNNS